MKRGKRKLNYVCKLILNAILLRVDISTSTKLAVNLLKKKKEVSLTKRERATLSIRPNVELIILSRFLCEKWIKSKTES